MASAELPPVAASAFADLLGVHHNTVQNWIKNGMPYTRSGKSAGVELRDALRWVQGRHEAEIRELRERFDSEGGKSRKILADARLKEIQVAEREGLLLTKADVEDTWTGALAAIRSNVMSVPANAVQLGLVPPAQEAALGIMCRDALASSGRSLGWVEPEEGEQ